MPADATGQLINFGSVSDPDADYSKYIWVRAVKGDTVRRIAQKRSHPEWAATILRLNLGRDVLPHPKRKPHQKVPPVPKLRNITQPLRPGAAIKLPGTMAQGFFFAVHCGDKPPVIKKGYANFDKVVVPGRTGINRFLDYDPIEMDIAISFEAFGQQGPGAGYVGGQGSIEDRIQMLERMAGRGEYPGAGYGPPAVIVVNTTDNAGAIIPLIPLSYQWTPRHQNAPQFRITNIAWDDSTDVLRNDDGYRVRQRATVTVTQYTPLIFVQRSLAQRAKQASKKPGTKKA
jgi:hypothetical protein